VTGPAQMLAVDGVTRTFGSGRTATHALRGVSFGVQAGQLVALRGRSGSGKTTLLNIVGGLDLPDDGSVRVADNDVTAMSEHERMELRRTSVAFIFQSFGLIPILSAAENVGVPLRIVGMAPREREERVRLMLDIVGLGEHAKQRPGELSGGQQQRVAIARALAGSPQVLLADEPTGQLDSETAKQIMRLLHTVVQSEGVTALVATHDPNLISIADSVLELEDGAIKGDLSRTGRGACCPPTPAPAAAAAPTGIWCLPRGRVRAAGGTERRAVPAPPRAPEGVGVVPDGA
jgi:putative ABC transport system ATP-binding protein